MKSLSPDILADENISVTIISGLRSYGYNVISVRDNYRGVPDSEIIKIAVNTNTLVLTEDRDFGEWIFSHKHETTGVIYLRYENNRKQIITGMLLDVLNKYGNSLYNKFTVITPEKIRIRDL